MRKQLLFVFTAVTIANFAVFSKVSGCGIFAFLPETLAWDAVTALRGQFFANGHPSLVLAISALFSGCFLTASLALLTLVARKKGLIQSRRSLSIAYAVLAVIYVFLSALPVPRAPC
jgi:hypothetical protein